MGKSAEEIKEQAAKKSQSGLSAQAKKKMKNAVKHKIDKTK